jgi:pantothenate synthetase
VLARARGELTSFEVEPEYVELVSADTLAPVQAIDGDVLAVIAARVGATRLIDNTMIRLRGSEVGGHGHAHAGDAGAPDTNGRA